MRKRILYIAATAILFAPACQREKEMVGLQADGALTAHIEEDVPGTRASFDGDVSSDNFIWNDNDEIAVHTSNGKYNVVKVYPDSNPKTGKFVCSTNAVAQRDYFAVYPAAIRDASHYGQSGDVLNVILPTNYNVVGRDATFSPVPMVAVNTIETPTSGKCHLEFYHVGGLLRLTLMEIPAGTEVVKVTLDKKITGTFAVSNPATDHPTISTTTASGDNIVTYVIADTENPFDSSEALVLNVPLPCGSYGSVQVQTFSSATSTEPTRTIGHTFDLSPFVIERHHGKKFSLGTMSFNFNLEEALSDIDREGREVLIEYDSDITITVEKKDGSVLVDHAPWKAYFALEAPTSALMENSWSETPLPDGNGNDWLTLSIYEGDGDADALSVNLSPAPSSAIRALGVDATTMQAMLQSGAGVTDLDLSRYDILKSPYDALDPASMAETANCYVIKTYGSYLIPCVYGNAYSGGAVNTISYSNSTIPAEPGGTAEEPIENPVLNDFINADGRPIANPVITRDPNLGMSSDLVARIIWQDVQSGYEILTDDDLTFVSSNGTALNCPYIRVNFQKDKIVPGNIIVALYDRGNSKILWSWHLWVTAETLSTDHLLEYVEEGEDEVSHDFLNVDLGWTPPISYTGGSTAERSQYVIIVCKENGRVLEYFKVTQAAYKQQRLDSICYSETRYQWGRKDPFLSSTGSSSNKSITHHSDFPAGDSDSRFIATLSGPESGSTMAERLQNMIRFPYKFFTEPDDVITYFPLYCNLWNVVSNEFDKDCPVTKTVYDPSPRRFQVPNRNAFTGLTTLGIYGSTAASLTPEQMDNPAVCKAYGEWVDQVGERPAGMILSDSQSFDKSTWRIYYPAAGSRASMTGETTGDGTWGNVRGAATWTPMRGRDFGYAYYAASPLNTPNRYATAFGVRPIQIPNE